MKNFTYFIVTTLILFVSSCRDNNCSINFKNNESSFNEIVDFFIKIPPPKSNKKSPRGSTILYGQHLNLNEMFPKLFEDVLFVEVFDNDSTIFFFSKPCENNKEELKNYEVIIWSLDSENKLEQKENLVDFKRLKQNWYSSKVRK